LADMYRSLFKFGVFNAIQSQCFDSIMHTAENMVLRGEISLNISDIPPYFITAPTGSGKTVLFELSIIRMFTIAGNREDVKCVYMAPTKALCSERFRDWESKFSGLGIKCCELTGDTVVFGKSAWGNAVSANIMFGEKWDSLTRSWRDHRQILSQIQLFLVDEVHILNESRGSTLEVVMSRMKTRGSAVRFICVSATVPNIEDIASWIGDQNSSKQARIFQFGEEFRPCQLERFVYGFPKGKNQNDFVFGNSLNFKLFNLLQHHSAQKPMLVFCPTRKGVFTTAEQLMKDYEKAAQSKQNLPWSQSRRFNSDLRQRLVELAQAGIGVHHAGLSIDDKRTTEGLFLSRDLRVVVATSTLAVGVNLPAHIVVIKGVKMFQGSTMEEYSDLDIMQMIGRAGRPQFDKEGIAIIMCEAELEHKYKNLTQGRTILESSLHLNLAEHINSEIGLGTITNVETAKGWLQNSFLFQRVQKNPNRYAIGKDDEQTWEERIDDMVIDSLTKLQELDLVKYVDGTSGDLCSTLYGDIMSKYYIRQSTMSLILQMPEAPGLRELVLRKIREHIDIRYKVAKIDKTSDKMCLLIQESAQTCQTQLQSCYVPLQAVLGGIQLNLPEYRVGDSQPQLEALSVFRHIPRIARALVEVALVKRNGVQVKRGLELLRSLEGKCWEDRPFVLRQIDKIGEKSIRVWTFISALYAVLAEHGITTFDSLRKQSPLRLDALLNRRSGAGHEILALVADLPRYHVSVKEVSTNISGDSVDIELMIECSLILDAALAVKSKKNKKRNFDMTTVLTLTSEMDYVDFRRIPTKFLREAKKFTILAKLEKPSQSICVHISSEMDLEGLDDDPDFWNMSVDEEEDISPKDEIKSKNHSIKDTMSKDNRTKPQALHQQAKQNSPNKLSNGKYMCNHSCKDKTSCRHMCCREGLDKPPLLRRRGSGPPTSEQPSGKATKSSKSSISNIKKENTDRNNRASKQVPKTAKNAMIRQDAGV
ncbi:hypothetical protein HETIRDRAFT_235038, partial [Heterobasidion irregulare TC 32-1]